MIHPWAEEVAHLYANLGQAHKVAGDRAAAKAAYAALRRYGREAGRPALEVEALNRLATLVTVREPDYGQAYALAREALAIAEGVGAPAVLAETSWVIVQNVRT